MVKEKIPCFVSKSNSISQEDTKQRESYLD